MKRNCIFIVSGEKPEDAAKFEASVKADLSPAQNGLCLSFLHNTQNQNLTKFDEVLRKKQPATLIFWGTTNDQLEILAKRALKKIPEIKFFSNRPIHNVNINFVVIKGITLEELPQLTSATAAVA